jgi:hypothetical protein
MILFLLQLFVFLSSCTVSINLIHTEGKADDVVDETQSANPDFDTDLSIPKF